MPGLTRTILGAVIAVAAGCGGDGGAAGDAGAIVDVEVRMPEATPIAPSVDCTVTTWREPATSREHREPCSDIAYPSHPPASGEHYSVWADFGIYDTPVPWGYLVHSLEHGAVVLAYDCPEGCDSVLAAFEAIIADHGADPACDGHDTADARFIVTPDPDLPDGTVAAVAWEHAYVASCLDEPSLRAFVDAHYGDAPEDLCAAGLDDSARGWCD